MGPTWKSVVFAIVSLAAICSAQALPVPFVADARACLMRSYSADPQLSSRYVDPNHPPMPDADEWREAAVSHEKLIVAYVVALELLLAAVAVIACLLALGLAGLVVKLQQRAARPAVPDRNSLGPFVFVPVKKLPI